MGDYSQWNSDMTNKLKPSKSSMIPRLKTCHLIQVTCHITTSIFWLKRVCIITGENINCPAWWCCAFVPFRGFFFYEYSSHASKTWQMKIFKRLAGDNDVIIKKFFYSRLPFSETDPLFPVEYCPYIHWLWFFLMVCLS